MKSNLKSNLSITSKRKILFIIAAMQIILVLLVGRIVFIQVVQGEELQARALEQQTRDRMISARRGNIFDRNMIGLAVTESAASVSVIRAQVQNPEEVAQVLARELELDFETVLEKVNQRVALMRIRQKVDTETAARIRAHNLPGVMIDEDIRRVYPHGSLAAQIIGFVGRDNQGIIGLEVKYDEYLSGTPGKILAETDVAGREIPGGRQFRMAPQAGHNLVTTLDKILQQYAEQTIAKIVEEKEALRGVIILMNPQNGEIYALANEPSFDLNAPFTIQNPELAAAWDTLTDTERSNALNQMWRNFAINDTYEPGSTFKIVTGAAGLEEGVITASTGFHCGGAMTVGGRMIRCWRYPRAHGSLTFAEGVQHSCNPVFMVTAEKLGAETFHRYLLQFGFNEKTGIDLPGEAVGIMYPADKIGPVELATMGFGQSLTITPLQLLRAGAAIVNGGYLVRPHLGMKLLDEHGNIVREHSQSGGLLGANAPGTGVSGTGVSGTGASGAGVSGTGGMGRERIISQETSETLKFLLETVVFEGTGRRAYIPGYRIGGKTATSQKLPRGSGRYISSFMAFAPADNSQVIALVLIDEPKGAYYGGQVAGPVMQELLNNALPYLNIQPVFNEAELAMDDVVPVEIPELIGKTENEAIRVLREISLGYDFTGSGDTVTEQFPMPGDRVNPGQRVIMRLGGSRGM